MKTPQQRGTFGAWLRDQRLAAGHENVPSAVKALQQAVGYGIAASVWAELEAGSRRPSKEQRDRLTMFFGSEPAESIAAACSRWFCGGPRRLRR